MGCGRSSSSSSKKKIDEGLTNSIGRIIGEPVEGTARLQSTLPTCQGGLGLMKSGILGQIVFISARTESGAFVRH